MAILQPALVKALDTRENYTKYISKLDKHPVSKEAQYILDCYEQWYEERKEDINWSIFPDYCLSIKGSNLPEEKKEVYSNVLEQVHVADIDTAQEIVSKWCTEDSLVDITYSIDSYLEGQLDMAQVKDAFEAFESNLDEKESDGLLTFEDLNFEDDMKADYKWKLNILNDATGGVSGGDLAIVFGRPNSGKTSFIVSETANMWKTIPDDKHIVWINNEESLKKTMSRYVSCLSNIPTNQLTKELVDKVKHSKIAKQFVGLDKPQIKKDEVENLLDNYPPAVLVFNNLDKIVKGSKESMHKELGILYQWARELAKNYNCVVFAVCQCNETGEGNKNLYQNMLQDSRTDKAGEADIIIGIGRDNDNDLYIDNGVNRYINICKNKLSSGEVEGLREVYGRVVKFDHMTGRYLNATG